MLAIAHALAQQAVGADEGGRDAEAQALYGETLDAFVAALAEAETPELRAVIQQKIRAYLARAEQLAARLSFADIGGHAATKELLLDTLVLQRRQPLLFLGGTWSAVLLYGPPGTGKTKLAEAAASEARLPFQSFTAGNVTNMYLGESEKALKRLFSEAIAAVPCVLFIDEVDALGRARAATDDESSTRIKMELCTQMDRAKAAGLFVLGATNRPWDLDPALLRRFHRHEYIGLPDAAAREAILRARAARLVHALSDADFAALAADAEGASGQEVCDMVIEASAQVLRKAKAARYFQRDADGLLRALADRGCESCADVEGAICGECNAMRARLAGVTDHVSPEPLTLADFRPPKRATVGVELYGDWAKAR